ncbi:MAG TPA: hypothetical protein VE983_03850 [Solirubrobacteraceae bacterium]|nr:hypothetical protein [Solirubrobacteraceae bacterium]
MTRTRRSTLPQVVAALVVVTAALVAVVLTRGGTVTAAPPTRSIGSMFQDDGRLIYASTPTVISTLNQLKALGVNQLRTTVLWKTIAPDPGSRITPRAFRPGDPAAYPAYGWAPYDRLVELARARGMVVDFNVTAPGPLWAMGPRATSARYADHWAPSRLAFQAFVHALGIRYSGRYVPPGARTALPRVSFWSIWNEPNQPGWLAPQWVSSRGGLTLEAPVLYRAYVDGAFAALSQTGHGPRTDTILVGDLAPEGYVRGLPCFYPRAECPIPPLPFLRTLYCVGGDYRPLSGGAATAADCPRSGSPKEFVSAHPGLFQATGFAHHPYSFFLAPDAPLANPQFAPLANLSRLEATLDSIFKGYGVPRRLPLYLDEYGYETNPPNPIRGVSLHLQALYLDEAEYMAWRDPRVRTLSQYLLYDSLPDSSFPRGTSGYWSTFQTGLLYANGRPKPALAAYRLPIFLPDPVARPGTRVLVWGMLRPAPRGSRQRAEIQWRSDAPGASFRTIQTVSTSNPSEVVVARVAVPGTGMLRVQWRAPSGQIMLSREATVTVR